MVSCKLTTVPAVLSCTGGCYFSWETSETVLRRMLKRALPRDDPVLDHHTDYQWSSIIKDSIISSREAPTQENRTMRGSSRSSIRDDLALGYGWYRPI